MKSFLPKGYRLAGAACGLKARRPDLGLIVCDRATQAAAVFTRNEVKAAPVLLCQNHLAQSGGRVRAILVNSGNANCCTGPSGFKGARKSARRLAQRLGVPTEQVLIASTGVIGVPLPFPKIWNLLADLVRGLETNATAVRCFSRAILTTDGFPKVAGASFHAGGQTCRILGFAKGAGMIHPQMATMLAFLLTDVSLSASSLRRALREACDASFHSIAVDGDTSTNDSVFLLANGAAGSQKIETGSRAWREFSRALTKVATALAKMIVRDGEGAKRLVEIEVREAANSKAAEAIARKIACSPLVKTALAGADPNWGRILAAAGMAGQKIKPERVRIWMAGTKVFDHGRAVPFDERQLHRRLDMREVSIVLALGTGIAQTTFWTCDLTHEYIRINSSYRT
jgi:glutamate N-acetyltransferase/amino-acid N-acetyltransferase